MNSHYFSSSSSTSCADPLMQQHYFCAAADAHFSPTRSCSAFLSLIVVLHSTELITAETNIIPQQSFTLSISHHRIRYLTIQAPR